MIHNTNDLLIDCTSDLILDIIIFYFHWFIGCRSNTDNLGPSLQTYMYNIWVCTCSLNNTHQWITLHYNSITYTPTHTLIVVTAFSTSLQSTESSYKKTCYTSHIFILLTLIKKLILCLKSLFCSFNDWLVTFISLNSPSNFSLSSVTITTHNNNTWKTLQFLSQKLLLLH